VADTVPNSTRSINVNIRTETSDAFRIFCEQTHRKQGPLLSALIEWFMSLDTSTRALILDEIAQEDQPGIARAVLERIAKQSSK